MKMIITSSIVKVSVISFNGKYDSNKSFQLNNHLRHLLSSYEYKKVGSKRTFCEAALGKHMEKLNTRRSYMYLATCFCGVVGKQQPAFHKRKSAISDFSGPFGGKLTTSIRSDLQLYSLVNEVGQASPEENTGTLVLSVGAACFSRTGFSFQILQRLL